MASMLEPEFQEAYDGWKTSPGPQSNAAILKAVQPQLTKAISMHVGESNPMLASQARQLALKSLPRYDSSRAGLRTFLTNELRGLKRVNRKQTQVIRAPERLQLDRASLQRYEQELADELGREPSDGELSDWSGFSTKRLGQIRRYSPTVAAGTLEDLGVTPGVASANHISDMWVQLVYDDLSSTDQRILEATLGLNGRKKLSNQALANKLGLSQGAISQRKKKIQELLDQEDAISLMLG